LNAVIAHHPGHGRRPHFAAAEAGRAVLAEGGNAVEAAIAVAATIAVVYPHMNSIGGDGFWLIHRPGQPVVAIDACGRAAAKADLALYAGLQSVPWRGPLAANTVAGAISGWAKAREIAPGTLPLSRLLAEAIAYARDGMSVTAGGAALAAAKSAELRGQPGAYAQIFEPEGKPLAEGDRLRQPALARTLERLAQDGLDSFYRGELALDLVSDLAALGSPVSAHDLSAHRAEQTEPLSVSVRAPHCSTISPHTGHRQPADPRSGRPAGSGGGQQLCPSPRTGRSHQAGLPVARCPLRRSVLYGGRSARPAGGCCRSGCHGGQDRSGARPALAPALAARGYGVVRRGG
jgi:hypothetical protein